MTPFYTVSGKSEYAGVNADFSVLENLLKNDKNWGANTLEMAGEYGWKVKLAGLWSYKPYSTILIPENADSLVAFNAIGKNSCLTYRIYKEGDHNVQVSPAGYLPQQWKVWISVGLAMFFIIPILLSPVIWKLYELSNTRLSRLYLDAFCRYLEDRVSHSEIEKDWSQLLRPDKG